MNTSRMCMRSSHLFVCQLVTPKRETISNRFLPIWFSLDNSEAKKYSTHNLYCSDLFPLESVLGLPSNNNTDDSNVDSCRPIGRFDLPIDAASIWVGSWLHLLWSQRINFSQGTMEHWLFVKSLFLLWGLICFLYYWFLCESLTYRFTSSSRLYLYFVLDLQTQFPRKKGRLAIGWFNFPIILNPSGQVKSQQEQ